MRLTTKIVLGIIVGMFLISLLFIIGFSFSDRRHFSYSHPTNRTEVEQKMIDFPIEDFNTIVLKNSETEPPYQIYFAGELSISANHEIDEEQGLSIPQEIKEFFTVTHSNDTMTIAFDREKACLHFKPKEVNSNYTEVVGININLISSKVDVINELENFNLVVKGISTDHIKLLSRGRILVEDCTAMTVSPIQHSHNEFRIKNSTVENLNIDLDHISDWYVDDCEIKCGNITGGGYHGCDISKRFAHEVNWYPKNKDAHLEPKLQGDSLKIVFQ